MALRKIVMCLAITSVYAVDYCGDELKCREGPHVGCNKTIGEWVDTCPDDAKMIPMTPEIKEMLLDLHNNFRSTIAEGKQEPYEPATRMATMTWDDDLAQNAEFNVRTCQFGHDKCGNTVKFNAAGQNIGIELYDQGMKHRSIDFDLKDLATAWYDEYKQGDMNSINDFHLPEDEFDPHQIGHFTQVVSDAAYAVGCAAGTFSFEYQGTKEAVMLTCDYAMGNVFGSKIYVSGPTASECKTGLNQKYPGLCSEDETWEGWYFN